MARRHLFLGTAIATLLAAPVHADTLRDALISAYETNPTLSGARASQRATDETVAIAKADGRPSATTDFGFQENFLRSTNSFTARAARSTYRSIPAGP
jgi:outer membrane protein